MNIKNRIEDLIILSQDECDEKLLKKYPHILESRDGNWQLKNLCIPDYEQFKAFDVNEWRN